MAYVVIEVWKPVVGRETDYEVSSIGRVRSTAHSWKQKSRSGNYYTHTIAGKILTPGIMSAGYPTISLGRAKGCRLSGTRTVHSLVAESFIGTCPEGCVVRHKNGNRADPRAINLEYGTYTENIYDAIAHGTWHSERRKKHWKTMWDKRRKSQEVHDGLCCD